MPHLISGTRRAFAGLASMLKDVYRHIIKPIEPLYDRHRERLWTTRKVLYSGIVVAEAKCLDRFFPKTRGNVFAQDIANYEQALVEALKSHVQPGTTVVVVGGGIGVTACVAAKSVGPAGRVICYEGNMSNYLNVKATARLNGVESLLSVVPAVVSVDLGVYTGEKAADIIDPQSLPACDVLELDCEGAETSIISHLRHLPRVVIVETHGCFGSSTASVKELLVLRGYAVRDVGVAEPRLRDVCDSSDIRCLVAVLDPGGPTEPEA